VQEAQGSYTPTTLLKKSTITGPNVNYQHSWPYGKGQTNYYQLNFDLSWLSAGTTIASAKLVVQMNTVFQSTADYTGSFNLTLYDASKIHAPTGAPCAWPVCTTSVKVRRA
jgi:hypothetical protein